MGTEPNRQAGGKQQPTPVFTPGKSDRNYKVELGCGNMSTPLKFQQAAFISIYPFHERKNRFPKLLEIATTYRLRKK